MFRLIGALLLAGTGAAAQTVEGNVINTVTGSGIPALRVEIKPVGVRSGRTTTSDAQGHFRFEDVPAGSYTASSPSPDYSVSPSDEVFQVAAGATPSKLELRMVPLPRVSGRVLDGRGEGVAHAHVELIGAARIFEQDTDATGRFDLRVFPGGYTLSVVPPAGLKPPDRDPDNDRLLTWTRTYYPGGALREGASKIVARPGRVVSDIELRLQAVPVHVLRGLVVNPDGTPAPNVTIALSEEADQPDRRAKSQAGGAFEFTGVVNGDWRLAAAMEKDVLRVVQWLEVAGHDREGVKLRLSPPFAVHGRVVMETPQGKPAPNTPMVSLVPRAGSSGREAWMANWMERPEMHFVEPSSTNKQASSEILDSFLFGGAISAQPNAGGDFVLANVYAGSYRIVPMPPPPLPYYLDAVRMGEADLGGPEVELSSGAVPVTIVYKTNGGTVRGTVEKCAAGPVLLIPQDPARQWLGFLRSARCDSNDRYEVSGVRPGEYYALAFSGDGPLPALDADLLNMAGKVAVRAGESSSADLRAISRPY